MAAPTITLDADARAFEPGTDESTLADPFGLDPEMRQRVLPAVRFLYERYWRVEATGAQNVPADGPALIVSNHSGAIPFDGAMLCTALEIERQRTLRFLYDRFVENLAPVAGFYNKVGGAVASRENAVQLLRAGELLLIFPEGVRSQSGDIKPFRGGIGMIASRLDVPVIPVRLEGVDRVLPTGSQLIRPARVRVAFGAPLRLRGDDYATLARQVEEKVRFL